MNFYVPFIAKKVSFCAMIETFHSQFDPSKCVKVQHFALYERNRKDTFHNLLYFTKVCHLDLLCVRKDG